MDKITDVLKALNDAHGLPATMYDNSNQIIKFFMINCIIRLEKTSNQNK